MFEIRAKDGLGRIGRLEINGKRVDTPTLMPVINPKKSDLGASEMRRLFGTQMVITNAYIIYNSPTLKRRAQEEGIHRLLDFDGMVETDSGSYQLSTYGDLHVTNEEILSFQQTIGSDVATSIDIPTPPDAPRKKAEEDLTVTLTHAREAISSKRGALNGTVQGSTHTHLRRRCARALAHMDFDIHPIGAVVPLLMQYRFYEMAKIVVASKKEIPPSRPMHLFGAGHPLILAFAVLLGCDLFDSAAYVLYAKDDRYLTPHGTRNLADLLFFPCSCPVCNTSEPSQILAAGEEERTLFLSLHNLYATFLELKKIRQAIFEGTLWDLVESRIHNHPNLLRAYRVIKNNHKFIEEYEPATKRSGFSFCGQETKWRPVVSRTKGNLTSFKTNTFAHPLFGNVPKELSQTYPFHVEEEYKADDKKMVMVIADWQFGKGIGKKLFGGFRIEYGQTGKVRHIYDGELLATLRPKDGLFVLTREGGRRLHDMTRKPSRRVSVAEEAVPFVRGGRDVFCKFVSHIDNAMRAAEEVLLVDERDEYLGVGKLCLAPKEIPHFKKGVAVKTRGGSPEEYE